jgi:hypothetical protein
MKKIAFFLFAAVLTLTAQAQNQVRIFEVYEIESGKVDKLTGKFNYTTTPSNLTVTVKDSAIRITGADGRDSVNFRVLISRYTVGNNLDFMVVDDQTGDLREVQVVQTEEDWDIVIHTVGNIVHFRAKL